MSKEQDTFNDMAHYVSHRTSGDATSNNDNLDNERDHISHRLAAVGEGRDMDLMGPNGPSNHTQRNNTNSNSNSNNTDRNRIIARGQQTSVEQKLSPLSPSFDSALYSTSDCRNKYQDKVSDKRNNNNDCDDSHNHSKHDDRHTFSLKHVRIQVTLLGLAIAVVNCYAQATFCIAIVEMVLPADFVVAKGEFGGNSVVKVVSSDLSTTTPRPPPPPVAAATTTTANNFAKNIIELEDQSCPVEYKYRDYYDSWRFLANSTSAQDPASQAINGSILDISDRFDWDASRQGLLLGAFAIGTAPLQVLGGRLAEIYGAKWVLFAGLIGTALTNLTIPFLAHFSFVLLMMNRVVMGIAQAGLEPGLMCLLAEWLTPAETGFFISMLLFAICVGFFLGSLCSSFILALGFGWPLAYYVAGGMNLVVAILWLLYASSRPRDSKLISSEELAFIEHEQQVTEQKSSLDIAKNIIIISEENNDLNTSSKQANISLDLSNQRQLNVDPLTLKRGNKTQGIGDAVGPALATGGGGGGGQAPWLNILGTRSVWAFIICKISIRWCADVLSIELPTYLANVLHLSIKLNGILNSVSSALFAIFSFITGYLVNELLQNHQHQATTTTTTTTGINDVEQNSIQQKQTIVLVDNNFLGRLSISKTTLRKSIQSIASFGSALSVFLMTQYDCNILFSMSMLLVLSCCLVMGTGGELQIPYDMTSRYPGTLHGLACTLSVSGWLAPPLIGLILGDQPSSRYRWSLVWYLTAFINLVGGLVFLLFADASPRDFDSVKRQPEQHKLNVDSNNYTGPQNGGGKQKRRRQQQRIKQHQQLPVAAAAVAKVAGCCGRDANRYSPPPPPVLDSDVGRVAGSQLAGYYNAACKSTDLATPPLALRSQALLRCATNLDSRATSGAANCENSDKQQQQQQNHEQPEKGQPNHQQQQPKTISDDLKWSPLFDRKLIRCRQVEESFIEPVGYLQNFDSLASQTMIFPYQSFADMKQKSSGSSSRSWSVSSLLAQLTGGSGKHNNRKPGEFESRDEQLDSMASLVSGSNRQRKSSSSDDQQPEDRVSVGSANERRKSQSNSLEQAKLTKTITHL